MQDMGVRTEYDDAPRAPRRSGGFLGKFIAVLLGLIIGILAGAGGLAGIIYVLVAKTKIKTNMNTVNSFIGTNINYADYINGKFGEQTIIDFAGETITAITKVSKGEGSLNTLNEISPLVGKLLTGDDGKSGLVATLNEFYLNVEPEAFMSRIVVKPAGASKNPDKYLIDYLKEKFNDVPVADFLIKMGYPLNDTLLAICCGIEGTEYVKTPDGKIQMLNGKKQLTLGEFLSSDLEQAVYRLPLDAIMPISLSDKVMAMLVYGDEYCYEKVTENGKTKVVMNQVFYTYDTVTGKLCNGRGAEVDPTTIQNANFTNGTCEIHADDNTVEYLKAEDVSGTVITLYAYTSTEYLPEHKIFYKKTTINDLQTGAVSLVEDMYLKDVLDIGIGSDRMLLSLAYGVKDVDYKIVEENGEEKIISINPPRTIGDLRDHGEDLIYEIYLHDVIDTDLEDKVTMYILYGKENMHYSAHYENGEPVVTMLQKQVAVVGDQVYNEYGDVLIGELSASNTFVENDATYTLGASTGNTLTTKDNTVATLYYVVDEFNRPVNFPYISLGDLKGNSPILENMTKRLTLADVLTDEAFEGHTVLEKLKDTKLENIPTRMEQLTVGEVYGDENVFLKAMQDVPLEQLSDYIEGSLTVGQLFGDRDPDTDEYIYDENGNIVISDNPLLSALSSTKVVDLEEEAQKLKIKDIVPDADKNQVLKHLSTSTLSSLSSDVESLTFNKVFYDDLWQKYDSEKASENYLPGTGENTGYAVDKKGNRILKTVWKYMLDKDITDTNTTIEEYYIVTQQKDENEPRNDMNTMMDNMTKNMQNASLETLIADDMIVFEKPEEEEDFLSAYLLADPTDPESERTYLRTMTIVDILNYVSGIATQAP